LIRLDLSYRLSPLTVLEARLDEFFNGPSMQESLEVVMILLGLEDQCEGWLGKIRKITTYHPNNLGNEMLGLVVPCD
jgi:hypothetical protein